MGRREIIRQIVRRVVPPSPERLIVDVGCGTGGNINAFVEEYACIGIDTSFEAIELATSRFPRIEFICGFAPADLGVKMDAASLFLLLDVIEHVEDDGAFLSELVGSMKSGSHLLITVPADMSLWSPHDDNYGHFRRYDVENLSRCWNGLSVDVRLLSYFNTFLFPAVKAVRWMNRLTGKTWGKAGTDLKVPFVPINRMLYWVLAREARTLVDLLDARRSKGFTVGVSLIALLTKK